MPHHHHHEDDSEFLFKEPCPACGSRDNLARYSDGHGWCFGCHHYEPGDGEPSETPHRTRKKMAAALIDDGEFKALRKRGITEETCRRYNYRVGTYNGKTVQIESYPDLETGEIVAQHLRFASKDQGMPWLGKPKQAPMFGQWLPVKSYKKLVVTEGAIDALSMSQVQGNKWPVWSITKGAQGAAEEFKQNLEELSRFSEVVLMFDMDEPGREAALECAKLLPPGKAKIAHLPLKDPNDMLVAGRTGELIDAMWNAKPYRPDGIVSGSDIVRRMKDRPPKVCYPYPECMPLLNQKTYGIRLSELDTWTSGSGMGKTTVIKQLQHHFWKTTPFNQAVIHLEEQLEDTAESLVGIHMGKRLNLPDVREIVDEEEVDAAAVEIFEDTDENGTHRFHLYDAFGSLEDDSLYSKIRYFAKALDCKIIWLDHLSIIVSDMGEEGDERRRIDSIMHNLASLAVELGIYIGLICHLKKAGGTVSFEEGAVPSLDDLRGSGGIKQLSYTVIALSRNQQHDHPIGRNTSLITVLKCRFTGRTGPADWLLFDDETGRMVEGTDPAVLEAFGEDEDTDNGKDSPDEPF